MKWEDCPKINDKNIFQAEEAPWSIFINFESKTGQEMICSGIKFCFHYQEISFSKLVNKINLYDLRYTD